ncbi:50S ribosomal protein L34 chloroplastic-like [Tripterygium wilfordii]|uniref:Large ribosomal subunit protein bL34c n=1 Tax=Tripterygium wilfordii TaxID=458696 RepID=A0A7J7C4E8_TRIWF|nr:50S ribosomal protein L34, chloroplastic-like [Tripterygium wilfordii]KAF5728717.1 50S ribosomal protein L34 chloroplastic-like [Tripterygium wilfordii]
MAATLSIVSASPPWTASKTIQSRFPSASLTLFSGSRSSVSVNLATNNHFTRPGLLHCSFISPSLSFASSFSGSSLGLDVNSMVGVRKEKGRGGLVVRAGKAALCLTKRSRSRKSLARTHGFRRRMRTTSGRAMLKRRRAKGRWVLCTKSHPNSGKHY